MTTTVPVRRRVAPASALCLALWSGPAVLQEAPKPDQPAQTFKYYRAPDAKDLQRQEGAANALTEALVNQARGQPAQGLGTFWVDMVRDPADESLGATLEPAGDLLR